MDKLFLIFLSSTFRDLEKERDDIAQAIRKMGYAPMGMEAFPASGEKQMDYIKRTIDKCDYYVLIIGGRYGSLTKEGISYTEAEYDYALGKGLTILAFIHDSPEDLPAKNTDNDPELIQKLDAFRAKVKKSYLVESWNETRNLPALVVASIAQAVNNQPATGWVRADKTDSAETLAKLVKAQEEISFLKTELKKQQPISSEITGLTNQAEIYIKYEQALTLIKDRVFPTWKEIFLEIAPDMEFKGLTEFDIEDILESYFAKEYFENSIDDIGISEKSILSIRMTLNALELIEYAPAYDTNGEEIEAIIWNLTPKGKKLLQQSYTARKPESEDNNG